MTRPDHVTMPNVQRGKAASPQRTREQDLTLAVLDTFAAAPDHRLRELLQAVVRHLHDLVREVRLTEAEWRGAIEFLTAVGRITDQTRQEFVLLSDVLGISMQTVHMNNDTDPRATETTVLGPFYLDDSTQIELGADIADGAPGQPCWLTGTVTDVTGAPVRGARIEVWEADSDGLYDVQYPDGRRCGRGHLFADDDGRYRFWALTPTPYPIPHDGPVGQLLEAVGRSPLRAAHLHFLVSAPGKRTLVTHIFVANDPQLDIGDSVFGVRESLVKAFVTHRRETPTPDGRDLSGRSWSSARFDIVLADV